MKKTFLYISPVNGICNEMYNPDPYALSKSNVLGINNHVLNANNHFWSLLLDDDNVLNFVSDIVLDDTFIPWKISALSNKKKFVENIKEAKLHLCDREISPELYFSYLEILNQLCILYSEYRFYPWRLSLQEGFLLESNNSHTLWENVLNPRKNPYLSYIQKYIIPIIENYNPDIVFFEGRPNYYSFAIARILKERFPHCLICHTRHSSEYFSMNKIENLLLKNEYYFRIIDVTILEFFEETEAQIINGSDISIIPNIIYRDNIGCNTKNKYDLKSHEMNVSFVSQYTKAPIANVHLEPNHKCHWDKCVFCGINKKYHFENNNKYIFIDRLSQLHKKIITSGVSFLWFIDEALTPIELRYLSQYLLENNLHVSWQVRARISSELIKDNLPELLARAGLKEIRLGLESASTNILNKMNKIDTDFSLDLVREICSKFSAFQVAVHFPIIIGFPGESRKERRVTYEFLQELCEEYPLVSFNINILQLDVASSLFKNWTNFEMSEVRLPCKPQYYLGNFAYWEPAESSTKLEQEQDAMMRSILYPWMPRHSTLLPHIFYRLCETSRHTLLWKTQVTRQTNNFIQQAVINPNVTISFHDKSKLYIFYNWLTHHFMVGDQRALKLFEDYQYPGKSLSDLQLFYTKAEVALIKKWIHFKFIIDVREVIA